MFAGFAFGEILSDAEDRAETVGQGLLHLPAQGLRGFAVVLAALRVAKDDVPAALRRNHGGGYFARVGSCTLGGAILCSDLDVAPFQDVDHPAQVGERRADNQFHLGIDLVAVGCDLTRQLNAFGRKGVHLPVAGDDFGSHDDLVLYYEYKVCSQACGSHHFFTSSIDGAFSPSLFFLLKPHRSLKNLPAESLRSESTVR